MRLRRTTDPDPIPYWALASDTPYPCPCGRPMRDAIVAWKSEDGFVKLFHPECVELYLGMGEESDD